MPYCDDCEKYWAPSAMRPDGTCPTCRADLDAIAAAARGTDASSDPESDGDTKTPWHFKLMIVALVVYLGWRFVEIGVEIFT